MLADVSQGRVTVVPPLDSLIHAAAPDLLRPEEAEAWLHATRDQPPDIRHGLMILASLDAPESFEVTLMPSFKFEGDSDFAETKAGTSAGSGVFTSVSKQPV